MKQNWLAAKGKPRGSDLGEIRYQNEQALYYGSVEDARKASACRIRRAANMTELLFFTSTFSGTLRRRQAALP